MTDERELMRDALKRSMGEASFAEILGCPVWNSRAILSRLCCIYREMKSRSKGTDLVSWKETIEIMIPITNKPTPKLRKASQPPLSYSGAPPDSDRAKSPPLAEPAATDQELNPGDRVGLSNFGTPTGEFGTVQQANDEDAVVK